MKLIALHNISMENYKIYHREMKLLTENNTNGNIKMYFTSYTFSMNKFAAENDLRTYIRERICRIYPDAEITRDWYVVDVNGSRFPRSNSFLFRRRFIFSTTRFPPHAEYVFAPFFADVSQSWISYYQRERGESTWTRSHVCPGYLSKRFWRSATDRVLLERLFIVMAKFEDLFFGFKENFMKFEVRLTHLVLFFFVEKFLSLWVVYCHLEVWCYFYIRGWIGLS